MTDRIAYTAGVVDSLGVITFSLDNSRSFTPQFQVVSKCFDMLDYCWTTFGLGGISEIGPQIYTWYVSSRGDIYNILRMLRPYMINKNREVEIMIEYLGSRMEHRTHNTPYTIEELEYITELVEISGRDSKVLGAVREKWNELHY